jgi:hypothetical protein
MSTKQFIGTWKGQRMIQKSVGFLFYFKFIFPMTCMHLSDKIGTYPKSLRGYKNERGCVNLWQGVKKAAGGDGLAIQRGIDEPGARADKPGAGEIAATSRPVLCNQQQTVGIKVLTVCCRRMTKTTEFSYNKAVKLSFLYFNSEERV